MDLLPCSAPLCQKICVTHMLAGKARLLFDQQLRWIAVRDLCTDDAAVCDAQA